MIPANLHFDFDQEMDTVGWRYVPAIEIFQKSADYHSTTDRKYFSVKCKQSASGFRYVLRI